MTWRVLHSHRHFFIAALGFGLCLSSLECERYTAFWSFGLRSMSELVVIVVLTAVGLWIVVAINKNGRDPICKNEAFIFAVAIIQMVGICGRIASIEGYEFPGFLDSALRVALQCAGFLFVLYGNFFLGIGVRKFVSAFAIATFVAGFAQITIIFVPRIIAYTYLVALTPVSAVLLMLANRYYDETMRKNEWEDVEAESGGMIFPDHNAFPPLFYINIFLNLVLMMALSHQGILLQDEDHRSRLLQVISGGSAVVFSLLFAAALNVFKEVELVELLRTILLPLILLSLYLSILLDESGLSVYMAILEILYLSVFILILVFPRGQSEGNRLAFLCKAYLSSRLGWALGFFGFITLSPQWGSVFIAVIVVMSFMVLLILSGYHSISNARLRIKTFEAEHTVGKKEENEKERASEDIFIAACEMVAAKFKLTPRENEVLKLLARGRNARYVSATLNISDGTARTHIMHIYQKTNVNSQQLLMDIVDATLDELARDSHP